MNLETALAALQHIGYPFPEAAVRWAVEHPAEITPALLDALRETPAQIMAREPEYFFNVHAMFLLAQFREPAAFPLVIDFHAAIGEAEDPLVDDLVTEDLPRILASLYPGHDTDLRRVIENPRANEWVRGARRRSSPHPALPPAPASPAPSVAGEGRPQPRASQARQLPRAVMSSASPAP